MTNSEPNLVPSSDAEWQDYLSRGGKITAPHGAPARYRADLMRLMASFIDSELAGVAGFADCINTAPGLTQRIAAARIVQEKLQNAQAVLSIMGSFGANTARYATTHPWAARLPREANIGNQRQPGDMRLNVFHYPVEGWVDAVVLNVIQGAASVVQIEELTKISYAPLAEAFGNILQIEKQHLALGQEGLAEIVAEDGTEATAGYVSYWLPRVAAGFGASDSARFTALQQNGLRHTSNEALESRWQQDIKATLAPLGLA